jgi:hypothetical protein
MEAEAQIRFSEALSVAQEQSLPFPLVIINGQLRGAGSAHYYQVLPLVTQVLEMEEATTLAGGRLGAPA